MTINRGRVRWQCRRALLELDLVFARFLERDFDQLDERQLAILDEVLRTEDHDLWAMVNGSKACEDDRWREILDMLRCT